jgi:hypothetical protein
MDNTTTPIRRSLRARTQIHGQLPSPIPVKVPIKYTDRVIKKTSNCQRLLKVTPAKPPTRTVERRIMDMDMEETGDTQFRMVDSSTGEPTTMDLLVILNDKEHELSNKFIY